MTARFGIASATSRLASEDRAEVFERNGDLVVVVADGAGGMRGGATASDAIVGAVKAHVEDASFDLADLRAWFRLVERVDGELARAAAGESTLVLAVVGTHGIIGVSAGDSEAWIVDETRVDRLTEAQRKARVGSGRCVATAFGRAPMTGKLVVATDGLFRHVGADAIAACCRGALDAAPARLVALARLPSERYADDVGVIVVEPEAMIG
jgi:hypothetical protein